MALLPSPDVLPSLEAAGRARHGQDTIHALPSLLPLAPNSAAATCAGAHLVSPDPLGTRQAEQRASEEQGPSKSTPKSHSLSKWESLYKQKLLCFRSSK